jgi:hypothetical protein
MSVAPPAPPRYQACAEDHSDRRVVPNVVDGASRREMSLATDAVAGRDGPRGSRPWSVRFWNTNNSADVADVVEAWLRDEVDFIGLAEVSRHAWDALERLCAARSKLGTQEFLTSVDTTATACVNGVAVYFGAIYRELLNDGVPRLPRVRMYACRRARVFVVGAGVRIALFHASGTVVTREKWDAHLLKTLVQFNAPGTSSTTVADVKADSLLVGDLGFEAAAELDVAAVLGGRVESVGTTHRLVQGMANLLAGRHPVYTMESRTDRARSCPDNVFAGVNLVGSARVGSYFNGSTHRPLVATVARREELGVFMEDPCLLHVSINTRPVEPSIDSRWRTSELLTFDWQSGESVAAYFTRVWMAADAHVQDEKPSLRRSNVTVPHIKVNAGRTHLRLSPPALWEKVPLFVHATLLVTRDVACDKAIGVATQQVCGLRLTDRYHTIDDAEGVVMFQLPADDASAATHDAARRWNLQALQALLMARAMGGMQRGFVPVLVLDLTQRAAWESILSRAAAAWLWSPHVAIQSTRDGRLWTSGADLFAARRFRALNIRPFVDCAPLCECEAEPASASASAVPDGVCDLVRSVCPANPARPAPVPAVDGKRPREVSLDAVALGADFTDCAAGESVVTSLSLSVSPSLSTPRSPLPSPSLPPPTAPQPQPLRGCNDAEVLSNHPSGALVAGFQSALSVAVDEAIAEQLKAAGVEEGVRRIKASEEEQCRVVREELERVIYREREAASERLAHIAAASAQARHDFQATETKKAVAVVFAALGMATKRARLSAVGEDH